MYLVSQEKEPKWFLRAWCSVFRGIDVSASNLNATFKHWPCFSRSPAASLPPSAWVPQRLRWAVQRPQPGRFTNGITNRQRIEHFASKKKQKTKPSLILPPPKKCLRLFRSTHQWQLRTQSEFPLAVPGCCNLASWRPHSPNSRHPAHPATDRGNGDEGEERPRQPESGARHDMKRLDVFKHGAESFPLHCSGKRRCNRFSESRIVKAQMISKCYMIGWRSTLTLLLICASLSR